MPGEDLTATEMAALIDGLDWLGVHVASDTSVPMLAGEGGGKGWGQPLRLLPPGDGCDLIQL